jgi:hypothetical protein
MERTSALSTAEIVGVAAASAAALGGVIVALGRSQASTPRERVEEFATTTAPRVSKESVERGRELARNAAASLVASYPDLREGAADLLHRAADSARPKATQVSSGAASTAEQVRVTGATVLDRLQEEVLPAASTAIAGLVERAGEARERSAPVASDMKSVAAAKADMALTKSTSAAKDTLATLAWAATALTLVYLVLLSPERREQLKTFLWGAVDQGLVLVRDFQGYEDEF